MLNSQSKLINVSLKIRHNFEGIRKNKSIQLIIFIYELIFFSTNIKFNAYSFKF